MSTDVSRDCFRVVVHLLLQRGKRVFLLRRASTGFMDGYYSLPGGHLKSGEPVTAAAVRECLEETGAEPLDMRPHAVLPYIAGRRQGFNFLFSASRFSAEPRLAEPDLFDRCCWAERSALPEPVAPWLREALAMSGKEWFRELHFS